MPGRVSVRTSRASAPAAKPRSSVAARRGAATEIPDEGPHNSLREQICAIFGDAQRSNTGQRKLVVRLRKIQETCCYEPASSSKQTNGDDFDENDFNEEVSRCILRVLPVKKSESAGDKIIKFLGVFLKRASDLDNAIIQEMGVEDQPFLETPTSRLTSQIMSTLLPLLPAKDKVIRFRSTQIISHLINSLDSVDDELFFSIRLGLLKRLRDKESTVRVQAVYGLGRLAGEAEEQDDEDSDDETAGGVLEKLLDVLQNDSSAEVRRSLLLNLPFTPSTLPYLLERARDMDGNIRRTLYSRLLPALGDFRHLSLTHREKLLRWGLRDRDDNVTKSAARLFRERWIEDCAGNRGGDGDGELAAGQPVQAASPSLSALLELLERIDVVNSGTDGGIALDAMKQFWEGRPDYCDFIVFDEAFWNSLTPESVFVARTFNDFCQQSSSGLGDKMPEVTRIAFLIQQNVNQLAELVRNSALQEDAEEESVQQEFIVEQLLQIALTLDYSDEVGRRQMFSLMREALALAELPEEATRLVVDNLRLTCGTTQSSEREFSSVVLEAIAEVHDTIMGDTEGGATAKDLDESFHSAKSDISEDGTPKNKKNSTGDGEEDEEKAIREIMVNMKCLHIAQCMLQNVESSLEQNSTLVTMLNNLVVPAVRSQEAPIRERGLLCLGLCCLLDKNLAQENLELFLLCFSKGHEELQSIAIQIIGDMLSSHPSLLVSDDQAPENQSQKAIHKMFSKSLKSSSPSVQSTACTALAKLMLSLPRTHASGKDTVLQQDELLRLLTITYFDPDTAANPALRQSLSYFLPVYCHSRKENMQRMGRISLSVLHWCVGVKEEMDVEAEDPAGEMVGLAVVVAHLVDWTDSRKLAAAKASLGDESRQDADGEVHLELAIEILEKVLGPCSKDERKLCISMLGKLHISQSCDLAKLKSVSDLVKEAVDDKIANDAPTRNALNKFQSAVDKVISSAHTSPSDGRPRSVAPLAMDDTDGENDAQREDTETSRLPGTPATSPRKTLRRNSKSPRKNKPAELTSDAEDLESNFGDATGDVTGLIPTIKEDPTEDVNVPQPPSLTLPTRPKWSPAELEQQQRVQLQSVDKEVLAADIAAIPSIGSDEEANSQVATMLEEAPKRRGRPARAPGATTSTDVAASTRPPRRSVRANRRQQPAAGAYAEDDQSDDEE